MTHTKVFRFSSVIAIAGLLAAVVLPTIQTGALSSTSLTQSDPRSSQVSTYTFDSAGFTTGTTIRCIDIFLNTQSDGGGAAAGTTTSSTLDSATAVTAGSWTVDNTSNGRLRITNGAGEAPSASGNIVFGNVTNAGTEGTYFGIFTSYTDASCTGGNEVDQAVVSYALKDGELVQLTINPTLTFTCSSVATGQTVNGATTTVTPTASGINHGSTVTFAANGISAHDLSVATNASGGYTVSVRHTGLLTNGSSDTIDNWTGTNTAPTSFPAAGTEAWGYTTEDFTLAGGTANRFSANLWSGFNTANEPVIDNTSATSGTEITRVGHQVGVATTTESGTYQTTIVYTVAAVY